MKRLSASLRNVSATPVDLQTVQMCKLYPDIVNVQSAASQFRWIVVNGGCHDVLDTNVDDLKNSRMILKEFLCRVLSVDVVEELEVIYAECS